MIKYLNIKNFKCFEDEKIELSRINILSGINGSGKSTIIQSLLYLVSTPFLGFKENTFTDYTDKDFFSISAEDEKGKEIIGMKVEKSGNIVKTGNESDFTVTSMKISFISSIYKTKMDYTDKEQVDIVRNILGSYPEKESHLYSIVNTVIKSIPGSIIILENPEDFLHPSTQSKLGQFLYEYSIKRNLHLIIETHSDHIINAARVFIVQNPWVMIEDFNIIFLNQDFSPTYIKINKNGGLSSFPEGFMDEYEKALTAIIGD